MTTKDYALIAEAIREHRTLVPSRTSMTTRIEETRREIQAIELDALSRRLSRKFAQENSRFDRAKFLEACGVRD